MLETILDQLDSDMDWELTDPLQKGYFAAGERRFDLSQLKKGFTKTSDTGFVAEKLVNMSEKKTKSLENNPSSSSGSRVKLEFPLWSKFKEKVHVLKTGKGLLCLISFAHSVVSS